MIGDSIHEEVDIDLYFCWRELDLRAAAIRRAFLRLSQANMAVNMSSSRESFPPYNLPDLSRGRFIPLLSRLSSFTLRKLQTGTSGDWLISDSR